MEVRCLSCDHAINLNYDILYQYYICVKCFKIHKKENDVLQLDDKTTITSFEYHLPITTTIIFENQKYIVSNSTLKKDAYGDNWREYELVSENNTKIYFTEESGNWTVSKEIDYSKSIKNKKEVYHDGIDYALFDKGNYCDFSGVGFFDYKINNTEKIEYYDFICPPLLFSTELEGKDQTSYLGRHISAKEIKKIANIDKIPERSQIGMVQPFYVDISKTIIVFCFACIFILISHLFFFQNAKNQLVYSKTIDLVNENDKEISTDVFELKGPIAPLKIYIETDVNNSWVATDFSLVNQTTGESSYFSKDVEYYYGYEGGENWTEGNTAEDFNICGVSSGKYKISFVPNKDVNDVTNSRLKIDVYWDKSDNWNFTFVFVLFLAITLILFLIRNSFEHRRWNDSDYSPYTK